MVDGIMMQCPCAVVTDPFKSVWGGVPTRQENTLEVGMQNHMALRNGTGGLIDSLASAFATLATGVWGIGWDSGCNFCGYSITGNPGSNSQSFIDKINSEFPPTGGGYVPADQSPGSTPSS
jgi:hypothetical protein